MLALAIRVKYSWCKPSKVRFRDELCIHRAARVYRDDNGTPWLDAVPTLITITMLAESPRSPYPITWDEQDRLLRKMPAHLATMALFAVNTGLRDSNLSRPAVASVQPKSSSSPPGRSRWPLVSSDPPQVVDELSCADRQRMQVANADRKPSVEVVRAILRKCVNDWEWLDRVPRVRMLKEPIRRIRFLTRDEARQLLAALPKHLADMAAFPLATGLRRGNVTGLQWSQVDLVRRLAWIHPDQAKARKAIAVPLNAEAVLIIRKQAGTHATHVFSFRGKPITQVSTKALSAALEKAGIDDFGWHDLRHTWAS